MKSFAVAFLALAAFVNAQGAPPCATDCVAKSQTSCSQSDLKCLCNDQNFITEATQCIITTCPQSDVQAAETFAQGLCASVGVTLTSTPPIPTSTGGAASSGSDSGSPPATDTGSGTAPTATGAASTGSPTDSTTSNGSQTSPATSPTTSPGSASGLQAGFTGIIGAALAALFL